MPWAARASRSSWKSYVATTAAMGGAFLSFTLRDSTVAQLALQFFEFLLLLL